MAFTSLIPLYPQDNLANQIPLCFQVGIFSNKAKTPITKYWGNNLPTLPPSAFSLIKTTYYVSAAPCAFYSQYNYCDIKKNHRGIESH